MKNHVLTLFFCLSISVLTAQGGLQFNRVFTLTDQTQTVPPNKVWKVTAVFGQETRVNECVDFSATSTHEVGPRARCGSAGLPTTISARFNYSIRGLTLNGINVAFSLSGFGQCPSSNLTPTNNCVSGTNYGCNFFQNPADWSCVNMPNDPNLLPIWLAAGSTLRTLGPNTFASVIEFNIVP